MSLIYRFAEYELNVDRLELRRAGTLMRVDALVIRLLGCLVRNAGRLVTKDELVEQVWEGRAVADNAITVSMARLRKALAHGTSKREFISTLYGRGYRLDCEVTAAHARDEAPPLLARAHDQTHPVVGRERVFERLSRALAFARSGQGRACALIGEPGIGKSCSVETFAREAAAPDLRVAFGHCREAGDTPPLWPWLRVMREMFARSSQQQLHAALGASASELLALCSEQPPVDQPAKGLTIPALQGPSRHRTFDLLVRAISLLAEQTPWLLVIEDLHRADAASLELFGYLLDEIPRTHIMVIATTRPVPSRRFSAPTPMMRVLGHPNCERFALERLAHADVKTYVDALLEDTDGRLADAVFAKSEGNPFFMVELSRQLRATERPDPDSLTVPDAALDLVWQPIARLDDETRRVLSAAAVLGRSFELSRLQAVLERDPGQLMGELDSALATDLLIAAPDSMTAFAFGHELLRSVLYDALPPVERRRWHLRVSLALEKRAQAGEPVQPSELAYHAYAALPESDPRKVVAHCRAAAAVAGSRFASLDVVRYLRHALEALELIEGASIRLRMTLLFTSSLYARNCDPEDCTRSLREVLRLAREHADGYMLVSAGCMLNVHPGYKPLPGATEALLHALEVVGTDPALRSAALAALACAAPQCYSAESTHSLLAEAVPLARTSAHPVSLYTTLIYKLWATGGPADPVDVDNTLRELEELARDHPKLMPVLPLDLATFRALQALQQGEQTRLDAALELAAARGRELDGGELSWHIERSSVIARINRGDSTDALPALQKLHRRAELRSIIGTAPFCAFDRVVVARELDGTFSVDPELRGALAFDPSEPPSIWSMKVRTLAAAGLATEARVALHAIAPGRLADLPCDTHYLGTLGHLARAALELREHDYAAALYPLLARYPDAFAGHVSFLCEGSVSQLLGALAHAMGRRAEAFAHLERGIRLSDHAGFALCAAQARLELARYLLSEHGGTRSTRAKELAREAQATTQRLGARRLTLEAAHVVQLVR